jgi:hypothetical protein
MSSPYWCPLLADDPTGHAFGDSLAGKILIGAGGGLITFLLTKLWEWYRRPRLKFEISEKKQYRVKRVFPLRYVHTRGINGSTPPKERLVKSVLHRIKSTNTGRRVAKNCRCHLANIEKKKVEGGWEEHASLWHGLRLYWSFERSTRKAIEGATVFTGVDILPEAPVYVDVLAYPDIPDNMRNGGDGILEVTHTQTGGTGWQPANQEDRLFPIPQKDLEIVPQLLVLSSQVDHSIPLFENKDTIYKFILVAVGDEVEAKKTELKLTVKKDGKVELVRA